METPEVNKPEEKSKFSLPTIKSRKIKIVAIVVGSLLIILIIFAAGVGVGLRKGRFSNDFGKNYERNFMGSRFDFDRDRGMMEGRGGFMGKIMRELTGRDFRNANGLSGTIISITDNNLVIKDRDNKENTVAVTDKTIIKLGRDSIQLGDLKQNDQVVVIGSPGDNGVINADLIRVFNNSVNN